MRIATLALLTFGTVTDWAHGQDDVSAYFQTDPLIFKLQHSGLYDGNSKEDALAQDLSEGNDQESLAAARTLWKRHSRVYAEEVLKYVAGFPQRGAEFRAFRAEVDAAVPPW